MNIERLYQLLVESDHPEFQDIRNDIVIAAQKILDEWIPDENGIDEVYGSGGACDAINNKIQNIMSRNGFDIIDGGQDGDDHAYTYAVKDNKAFVIDIPPNIYEYGAGYNWTKKPGIILKPDDIYIDQIPIEDVSERMNESKSYYDSPVIFKFNYRLFHSSSVISIVD